MRRAARIDNTHKALVAELLATGHSVLALFRLGQDAPDLLAGRNGRDRLIEVKTPAGPGMHGRKAWTAAQHLTPGQKAFADSWKGAPIIAAFTLEDVLKQWII